MKRVKLFLSGSFVFLLSSAFFSADNTTINIPSADTQLPNWQWTSGEVKRGDYAAKECITIVFDNAIYKPNETVKITFNSFKVTLTNLTKGTTFEKWTDKISLVYHTDKSWLPLVKDTGDRMNKPFLGVNNNPVDSLTDYTFKTTVPLSRELVITVGVGSWAFDEIQRTRCAYVCRR